MGEARDRPRVAERPVQRLLGDLADPEGEPGVEHSDHLRQRAVADRHEIAPLGRRELVRGEIAARFGKEAERTPVPDEEAGEEAIRIAEAIARPAPQTPPRNLAARTGEAEHRPLRMFVRWLADLPRDAEPVAHQLDLAERDARLHHAERPRIHAHEHGFLASFSPTLEVLLTRIAGVDQGVVDVGDRRGEAQALHLARQAPRDVDQRIHGRAA